MKVLELLEFRLKLNGLIKYNSFEKIFDDADAQFFNDFNEFIYSKVGQKWLNKSEGEQYLQWQNG